MNLYTKLLGKGKFQNWNVRVLEIGYSACTILNLTPSAGSGKHPITSSNFKRKLALITLSRINKWQWPHVSSDHMLLLNEFAINLMIFFFTSFQGEALFKCLHAFVLITL